MTDKIRKMTRLLAIPLLILAWVIYLIQSIIFLICCACDLNIEEWDYCVVDLFSFISDWIKEGADSL